MHLKQNALYSYLPNSTCRIAPTVTVYAGAQTAVLPLFQVTGYLLTVVLTFNYFCPIKIIVFLLRAKKFSI